MKTVPSMLAAPWAIEPSMLRVVFSIWSRGQLDHAALSQARAEWQARVAAKPAADLPGIVVEGTGDTLRIVDGIGVLSVDGALFRHANIVTEYSGGSTYDALSRGLAAAVASSQVRAILLRVDSPGGVCDGLNEFSKAVYDAAEKKRTWAHVDGMMASAAYWIGSQVEHIVAEESSIAGSIGVRCGVIDDSAAQAASGVREIEIISSVSPGKRSRPVDDEVLGRLQTRIDDLAAIFVSSVARGRGVSEAKVLADFGQGDVLIASKALAAGMIDEVGDFNSTLAALAASTTTSSTASAARAQRGNMSKKMDPSAPAAATAAAAIAAAPTASGAAASDRCAKCDDDMTGKASYCANCYDGDDDSDEDDDENAKAAAFGRRALALLGSDLAHADEALGALARHVEASAQLATRLDAERTAAGVKAKADVVAAVTDAIKGGRLKLGKVASVASMIDDDARSSGLASALDSAAGDLPSVLTAIGAVAWTPREAVRIGAMLGSAPAAFPAAVKEPPDDEENQVRASVDEATARKFGLDPARVAQLMNVNGVADLPRAKKGV